MSNRRPRRSGRWSGRTAALALGALCSQGCYTYQALPRSAAVPPGQALRVQLTDSGTVALAAQVGPGVYQLDGRVSDADARTLNLEVTSLHSRRSVVEQLWNGESVAIPRVLVEAVQRRQLSRPRTILLGALLVGGVVGAYLVFDAAGGGNRGGPGPIVDPR